MNKTYLKFAAALFISLGTASLANAESIRFDPETTPEPITCPVYAACGPGMVGYNAGIDENGCETMGCHPEGEQPPFDYPTGDGLPTGEPEPEVEYKYENPHDKTSAPPRAIEVQ